MLHFTDNDVPLEAGTPFDFTSVIEEGVTSFRIDEIDPDEMVDGETVPFVIGADHLDVDDDVELTITAIPEPSLALLQGLSLVSLAWMVRRRAARMARAD